MAKHVSVRFAWHDDNWDGGICRNPEQNVYCNGNYSLLSPRIQRRIDQSLEEDYKDQKISAIMSEQGYIPPCYWTINAVGTEKCKIEDLHPFSDTNKDFEEVPPLVHDLEKCSVCSWNFKLGYSKKGSYERYVSPKELKKRSKAYLKSIDQGSIAFFYANYSNPITGEDNDRKYLLLGAGLVRKTVPPQEYEIPDDIIEELRARPHMKNAPKQAWQFQIMLEPNSVFVIPYQKYLDLIDQQNEDEAISTWKNLDEVAIRIEDRTIIPNFKYVSMHVNHDKALYLLYNFRKSIRKMKEQEIIDHTLIEEIEKKIDKMLTIGWKQRTKYPGFRNALFVALKNDFDTEYLNELIPRFEQVIDKNFDTLEQFFESTKIKKEKINAKPDVLKAIRTIERNKDYFTFLSLFDFSIKQFENVEEIVDKFGLETIKTNPYLLLEHYNFDEQDNWSIDESDYGIGIYQIDIALIPDPSYAEWDVPFDIHARCPERLRALITKILYDIAINQGSSCLTRDEIVEFIQEYPLYYINDRLMVDSKVLVKYEKQPLFQEKFIINDSFNEDEVTYQLKVIRELESIIEQFMNALLRKNHSLDTEQINQIINKELEIFKDNLDIKERTSLYENSLQNGLFVLTGKAGSGKTTAVVNLIKQFLENKKSVFVFTPTGKANLVIRNRLKEQKLLKKTKTLRISTIHRFLYRALSDYYPGYGTRGRELSKLKQLVSKLLSGKLDYLNEFRSSVKSWEFNPKVVIIDEASMVDEVLLAVLLSFINPNVLEHLIIVGDEKQLPPIGIGRPFADLIYYLKQKGLDTNFIHLDTNLRFDPSKNLGRFSEYFSSQEQPSPTEIEETLLSNDDSFEVNYFSTKEELQKILKQKLSQTGCKDTNKSLFEMFAEIFDNKEPADLEKVQIITPRRLGNFGSTYVNKNVVLDRIFTNAPKTKLICEENIYFNTRGGRVLGLANGSIGYIKHFGYVYFSDIAELFSEYHYDDVMKLVGKIRGDIYHPGENQRKLNFGYAITAHKSQGSDFEHVILILSQISPFITRELLYTALTRPRTKLHLLVHENLKEKLPLTLVGKIHTNSSVEQRKTLLFGYKTSPFKPYKFTLKNGQQIEVDSKIERIIARILDMLDVEFEHGTKEFLAEYHLIPDFKLKIDDETYYIEHLGRMDKQSYRERWFRKLKTYEKIGIIDRLITTSESEERTDVDENIKNIVKDLKTKKLKNTEGAYSRHHYQI